MKNEDSLFIFSCIHSLTQHTLIWSEWIGVPNLQSSSPLREIDCTNTMATQCKVGKNAVMKSRRGNS